MAAADHIHPRQLRMFMTAKEIKETHSIHWPDLYSMVQRGTVTPRYGHPKPEDLWRGKREEAEESGHAEAMRRGEGGLDKPVHLTQASVGANKFLIRNRPGIAGGHHRIAVMAEEQPEHLHPVVHHESLLEAKYGHEEALMLPEPIERRKDFPFS